MKQVNCTSVWLDQWNESVSALKDLNDSLNDFKDDLNHGRKEFEAICTSRGLDFQDARRMGWNSQFNLGLNNLKERNGDSVVPLGYFHNWNTQDIEKWFNDWSKKEFQTVPKKEDPGRLVVLLENTQVEVFKENWMPAASKSGRSGRASSLDIYSKLIESNTRFLGLRKQVLGKEFTLDAPLAGTGLFLRKKENSNVSSDTLSSQEKAELNIKLWYRVTIKDPGEGKDNSKDNLNSNRNKYEEYRRQLEGNK
jgi:hypothetical protein